MGFAAFRDLITKTAARYGYDPALLAAQCEAESGFNPQAVSSAGARGLMQFMPGTWPGWGKGDPFDPSGSLDAGVRYMRWLMAQWVNAADPTALALASYNAGIGKVQGIVRATQRTDWEGIKAKLKPETQAYVPKILSRRSWYATVQGLTKAATVAAPVVLLLVAAGLGLYLRGRMA